MANKYITGTLHNISPVPAGSVYRGSGMFEFASEKDPYKIKLKLAEYDPEKKTYYKDKSVKVDLSADAIVVEKEKTDKITKVDDKGIEIKPVKVK